jgi:hypothetical protein
VPITKVNTNSDAGAQAKYTKGRLSASKVTKVSLDARREVHHDPDNGQNRGNNSTRLIIGLEYEHHTKKRNSQSTKYRPRNGLRAHKRHRHRIVRSLHIALQKSIKRIETTTENEQVEKLSISFVLHATFAAVFCSVRLTGSDRKKRAKQKKRIVFFRSVQRTDGGSQTFFIQGSSVADRQIEVRCGI